MDSSHAPDDLTRLLRALPEGDSEAFRKLFTALYELLHAQAHRHRQGWHGDLTLNTTALVHEAYLKLADQKEGGWESRSHFLCVAARAMRHILVDYARRRRAGKRNVPKVSLDARLAGEALPLLDDGQMETLLDLETALARLEAERPREARVVECRFFGGMSIDETAAALGVGARTVKRDWAMARVRLFRWLNAPPTSPAQGPPPP